MTGQGALLLMAIGAVIGLYAVLMLAALACRSPADAENRRTISRTLRSCANLLPILCGLVALVYVTIIDPLLPGYTNNLGVVLTWGCIFSPPLLAVLVTFLLPRKLYRVASSWWGPVVYLGLGFLVLVIGLF